MAGLRMLKTDRLPPQAAEEFWRPERKAWAILFGAFAIFCAICSASVYAGYQLAVAPRGRTVTAELVQPNTAFLKRAGLVRSEMLDDNTSLSLGDRVIVPEGPPGPAVRLHVEGATVSTWPTSSILVEESDHRMVRLRLEQGQALVDLPLAGPSLFVAAAPLAHEVELTAPGHYRVRWLSETGTITARSERGLAPGFEVATEEGQARIGGVAVEGAERLIASGETRKQTNRWSLVRDGDFRDFSADEYLATLYRQPNARASDTWFVSRQAIATGAKAQSGLFYVRDECNAVGAKQAECRRVARFARLGGNEKDSITAITQHIDADVSVYHSVMLEADVRIDFQSLSKGGADGSECPLFARADYIDSKAAEQSIYFCFWAFDDGQTGATSLQPYIVSQQIAPKSWHHFSVDLQKQIPGLRAIQRLVFYANGHDYDASVANIGLSATGLQTASRP